MRAKILLVIFASIFCWNSELCAQSSAFGAINRANSITNIYNRPTVSPYLRLLNNNTNGQPQLGGSGNAIYQTQVRPAVEQRRQTRLQQAQIQQLQNQLNSVQQSSRRPTASGLLSTGHPTRFMSFSHYYPALGGRR